MYTFEHVLEDSTVLMTCPLKVHIQFINRFGSDNVPDFIASILRASLPENPNKADNFKINTVLLENARAIFGLTSRAIGLHLGSCTDLFDRFYLPIKRAFTIKERRDILAKLVRVRSIATCTRYKQEVQDLLDNHSCTYKLDLFVYRGTGPTNNDYVKLLNALAQFYKSYRVGNDPSALMTTGLSLQKDYEAAVKEYVNMCDKKLSGHR